MGEDVIFLNSCSKVHDRLPFVTMLAIHSQDKELEVLVVVEKTGNPRRSMSSLQDIPLFMDAARLTSVSARSGWGRKLGRYCSQSQALVCQSMPWLPSQGRIRHVLAHGTLSSPNPQASGSTVISGQGVARVSCPWELRVVGFGVPAAASWINQPGVLPWLGDGSNECEVRSG